MGTGQKRTQSDYSLAFKQGVVDAVEKGEMTYKQAQRLYGIQGRSTVLVWLRKLGRLRIPIKTAATSYIFWATSSYSKAATLS